MTLLRASHSEPGAGRQAGKDKPGEAAANCVPNISLAERRKRLVAGVVPFVVGLASLGALVLSGADRWWRLPLLLVFWAAAVGYYQWNEAT